MSCVCAFVVYASMSVQSLGSCSTAPTQHWLNIKLCPSGQPGWGDGKSPYGGFIVSNMILE